MTKIYMLPTDMSLGIGRVVSAYRKYLPDYGFTFVDNVGKADLVVLHAGEQCSRPPDIAHNHGLYPTGTKMPAMTGANARVIDNLCKARHVTVPSQWVADQIRHNMLFDPIVLPHGIEPDEWNPTHKKQEYILWGKGHVDAVCDPSPVNEVAAKLPQYRFVTTFGDPADNVTVIGPQKYWDMRRYLQEAKVYLSTTKETFGIQTLEAMACGVPIVGWNWGCTPDIVTPDVGLLSSPRDVDTLAEHIDYMMQHAGQYADACVRRVCDYSWKSVVEERLAPLYSHALTEKTYKYDVSVVITCHNYGQFVGEAVHSALDQDYRGRVEIIVVDDASDDDSASVIEQFGNEVKFVRLAENVGVAMARNIGIQHAQAPIIASLDADDKLLPHHLRRLVPLVKEPGVGIAYGRIVISQGARQFVGDWPGDFNFSRQASGRNCVPSASVFRKEAWRRVGGYSSRFIRGEDSEFWLRIASIGYDVKWIDEPVYIYRIHGASISNNNREPDWVSDKPYSVDSSLTPFAAPVSGYDKESYPVYEYDEPWVSIIMPVGPGHETMVWRAVESVMKQSLPYWECIVVNDSGNDLIVPATGELLERTFPFIKIVSTEGGEGVCKARNLGAVQAKAGLLAFLDADDAIHSDYLAYTVEEYRTNPENYIYTDWMNERGESFTASEFSCELLRREAIHPVTAVVPKAWHDEIGGFDESFPGWEDWEYYLRLASAGHCGMRVAYPLVVYDYTAGVRRQYSREMKQELVKTLKKRYRRDNMACKSPGCNKTSRSRRPIPGVQRAVSSVVSDKMAGDDKVLVRYNLGSRHRQGVRGRASRIFYGKHTHGDVFEMLRVDQQMQPDKYVLVNQHAAMNDAVGPMNRSAAPPIAPPAPVPQVKRVEAVVKEPAPVPVESERYVEDNEEFEIDIATMPLRAIKQLGLDPEDALTALEVERDGRKRKAVMEYLEMKAQPAIEAAKEYDHEYADDEGYYDDDAYEYEEDY